MLLEEDRRLVGKDLVERPRKKLSTRVGREIEPFAGGILQVVGVDCVGANDRLAVVESEAIPVDRTVQLKQLHRSVEVVCPRIDLGAHRLREAVLEANTIVPKRLLEHSVVVEADQSDRFDNA